MNSRKESFIGKASENEMRVALSYKESADILFNSDSYQDGIVLPYLFLIRQFLELGLKYNIKNLIEVSGRDNLKSSLNTAHDLESIYNSFIAHYKGAKKNLKLSKLCDQEYLNSLSELIGKIVPLDNNSQGFRYSVDKENKKIIEVDKTFNLQEISDLLEDSKNILANTVDVFGLD